MTHPLLAVSGLHGDAAAGCHKFGQLALGMYVLLSRPVPMPQAASLLPRVHQGTDTRISRVKFVSHRFLRWRVHLLGPPYLL